MVFFQKKVPYNENNNRLHNSNTQLYLCGASRILNTAVTDIFMNSKIKKLEKHLQMLLMYLHFLGKHFMKNMFMLSIAILHF